MYSQAPQVLAIREVTGRIEAILSWAPTSVLLTEAEGAPLHLSSHVLDPTDGHMLLFDGPRGVPCLGPERVIYCVLPLSVPEPPGRYRIQIEPVVEHRFWGSERGYTPLMLDVEKRSDGELLLDCTTSGRRYVLRSKNPGTIFCSRYPPYTEWAIRNAALRFPGACHDTFQKAGSNRACWMWVMRMPKPVIWRHAIA